MKKRIWTKGRVAQLEKLFDEGASVEEMRVAVQDPEKGEYITARALRAQLKKLGFSLEARNAKRRKKAVQDNDPSSAPAAGWGARRLGVTLEKPVGLETTGTNPNGDQRSGYERYPPRGVRTVSLEALDNRSCHYPYDTEKGSVEYCGRRAEAGKSYCPAHCDIVYRQKSACLQGVERANS